MAVPTCNVCHNRDVELVYASPTPLALTSLCQIVPHAIQVCYCSRCCHVSTLSPLSDDAAYYVDEYTICADSDVDDQVYAVASDGSIVYRTDHQIRTLLSAVTIPSGGMVLDYGCAKASTLRRLVRDREDVTPFLFDVTDRYVPFWRAFAVPSQWSVGNVPAEWSGRMDVVVSYFALEHIPNLDNACGDVRRVLRPGGVFYFVVPNPYENIGDFIVADHVNHFGEASLRWMLSRHGFANISISDAAHSGAWVVQCRVGERQVEAFVPDEIQSRFHRSAAVEACGYWSRFRERVREAERGVRGEPAAIYGSGFYGSCLASCLEDASHVECFLDANPFRQGKEVFGKSILAPTELPGHIARVYVGLNPRIAQREMANVATWRSRAVTLVFP